MTTTLAHRSTAESIGLDTVAKSGSLSSVACIVLRRLTEHTRLNSQEYRAFDYASGRRADRAAQADGVPMSEAVTVFHSVVIPSISLEELTTALAGALHIDNACVLVAIMLFARYCQKTNQPPTEHLSHRLMVAALHVAVKVHAEAYLNSRHVAQAAGIGTGEVNRLEAALCQGLRWKLFVSREELDVMIADPKRYADQLLSTTAVENAAKLQAFMRRRLVLAARSDNHEDHNKENKKAADTPSILADPPATTQHEDPVQGMSMLWCRDPARPVARTFCKLSSENPVQNAVGSHAALLCHCAA